MSDSDDQQVQSSIPHEIQQLLQSYEEIFASKVSYPPPRACSHTIPLIHGVTPFSIRPYRYAPALKTEIEKQVEEMLREGLIQPNTSAFSSPVLLVKKKGKIYYFCVDYRHLNAITVKGSFPVPTIDELLDELGQASCFCTLNLCAGFHNIPMEPSDCFKTAFQIHLGHYEFRVMSFGLTGAPHTF
jgi:hypothetical protein